MAMDKTDSAIPALPRSAFRYPNDGMIFPAWTPMIKPTAAAFRDIKILSDKTVF